MSRVTTHEYRGHSFRVERRDAMHSPGYADLLWHASWWGTNGEMHDYGNMARAHHSGEQSTRAALIRHAHGAIDKLIDSGDLLNREPKPCASHSSQTST